MRNAIKEGDKDFDVWINRKGRYGHNISISLTAGTFTATILPALKVKLAELRKEYKAIPPIEIVEKQ